MRYFIIMYKAITTNNSYVSGTETTTTSRNRYLSRTNFINELKEKYEYSSAVIYNIIELSKKDFNNWNS